MTVMQADPIQFLFNEELGAVIQIRSKDKTKTDGDIYNHQIRTTCIILSQHSYRKIENVSITQEIKNYLIKPRIKLQKIWSETSFHMQPLRDNPECVKEEFDALSDVTILGYMFH